MTTITDEMIHAALEAQAGFRMRLANDGEAMAVYDERGKEPVEIGRYESREEAENAVLWHGQRAALEAAERARPREYYIAVSPGAVIAGSAKFKTPPEAT